MNVNTTAIEAVIFIFLIGLCLGFQLGIMLINDKRTKAKHKS